VRLVAEHAPGSTPPSRGARRPAARIGGPVTPTGVGAPVQGETEV
jgi:hypothetical protein